MFKKVELFFIRLYQQTVSKQSSGKCRLRPTCSNYALIALKRFGFIKGNFLIFKRFFRCANKHHQNLTDNVPQNIKGEYKWLI